MLTFSYVYLKEHPFIFKTTIVIRMIYIRKKNTFTVNIKMCIEGSEEKKLREAYRGGVIIKVKARCKAFMSIWYMVTTI